MVELAWNLVIKSDVLCDSVAVVIEVILDEDLILF